MNEIATMLGKERSLVAVITEPPAEVTAVLPVGAVLLNSGWVHRPGPHRTNVLLARRLAAKGVVSVRFDFSGVGDSPARTDGLPVVRSAIIETREVMDQVSRLYGLDAFVLIGNCSGGSVAYFMAVEDPRVVGAVLMNVQTYDISPLIGTYVRHRSLADFYWRQAVFDPRRWRRLLTGRSSYQSIRQVLSFQVRQLLKRGGSPLAEIRPKVASELRSLLERNVALLTVLSEGDAAGDHMRLLLGSELPKLQRHARYLIEVIPRTDHLFTPGPSREQLLSLIERWMDRFAEASESEPPAGEPRTDASGQDAPRTAGIEHGSEDGFSFRLPDEACGRLGG